MADHVMPGPSEIFADIQARPAAARERAKGAYVGRVADWALRLVDRQEEPDGSARVLFRGRPHEVAYVAATVRLADYPWLNALGYGQPVQVHGLIAEVGKSSIELAGTSLLQLVETVR